MALLFSDNFSSFTSSPDGSEGWKTQGTNDQRTLNGSYQDTYYSDSSVPQYGPNPFADVGGVLTITANLDPKAPAPDHYSSGLMTTEKSFAFEYGMVEVTAKMPAGSGMWPAIWMIASSGWPPEIDIMEQLNGNPSVISVGAHPNSVGAFGIPNNVNVGVDTTAGFHTYGVDWEPDKITWYFDGKAIYSEATPADMHQPMYVLINNGVAGQGSNVPLPNSASEFPATMSVSEVQIFSSANTINVTGTAAAKAITTTGAGVDGPISGATVFADANGTGVYASGDASTTTDAHGQFTITNGLGPLVLTGGTDTLTGLAFTGTLAAPAGSTVITPLTTLINAIAGPDANSGELTSAQTQVLGAFGITLGPSQTLLTLNPYAGTLSGDAASKAAYVAGAEVLDTAEILAAGIAHLSGQSATAAFNAVISAIAADIYALPSGHTLDLTNVSTVESIITAAGAKLGVSASLATGPVANLATLATASNSALLNDVAGHSGADAVKIVTQVEYVAQGETAPALGAQNASFPNIVAAYTGTHLTTAISAAAASVACYLRGTHIETAHGDVAIEDLKVGDRVRTESGELRAIKWLGSRRLDCALYADPAVIWPICVGADAFGAGSPRKDLWLSPGHSLSIEGVLIPVEQLLNGVTVRQEPRPEVEYWHLELDTHDVVFAEGVPSETYLDTGNRSAFSGGGAFRIANPEFKPKPFDETCKPLAFAGPVVDRAKAGLLAQVTAAGWTIDPEPDLHLVVDGVRLEPMKLGALRYAFALPQGARSIVLASNVFIPAEIAAEDLDRRSLGLCLGRVQIDGDTLPLDRDDVLSEGWHYVETLPNGAMQRWTNGAAKIAPGAQLVLIDLAGEGKYWRAPKAKTAPASNENVLSAPTREIAAQ